MLNSSNSGVNMNGGGGGSMNTKQQMLQYLVNHLKFPVSRLTVVALWNCVILLHWLSFIGIGSLALSFHGNYPRTAWLLLLASADIHPTV